MTAKITIIPKILQISQIISVESVFYLKLPNTNIIKNDK